MAKNIFIIRGIQGSGKSTAALAIAGGDDLLVCESDEFMTNQEGGYEFDPKKLPETHQACKDKFNLLVSNEEKLIVVSNTSKKEWEFDYYKLHGEASGYTVHILVKENRHGGTSVHNVPLGVVNTMKSGFEIAL